MTRFAGHKDITNFVQRNQFADKIGAAGMNAYADQTAMNFDAERATVNAGVMGEARVAMAEQDAKAIKAGAQAQAQAGMVNSISSGIGTIAGGLYKGGHLEAVSLNMDKPNGSRRRCCRWIRHAGQLWF